MGSLTVLQLNKKAFQLNTNSLLADIIVNKIEHVYMSREGGGRCGALNREVQVEQVWTYLVWPGLGFVQEGGQGPVQEIPWTDRLTETIENIVLPHSVAGGNN